MPAAELGVRSDPEAGRGRRRAPLPAQPPPPSLWKQQRRRQAHSRLARLGLCCFRSGWGGLSPTATAITTAWEKPRAESARVPESTAARVRGKAGRWAKESGDAENKDRERGAGKDPCRAPGLRRCTCCAAGQLGAPAPLSSPTCASWVPAWDVCWRAWALPGDRRGGTGKVGGGGDVCGGGDVGRHGLIPARRADYLSAGLAGM